MFGLSNVIKPSLDFTGKVEKFHRDDDEMFSVGRLFAGNADVEDEIICKVQTVHDLKKSRFMFKNLVQIKDNCHSDVGGKCHLFLEDDEIKIKTIKENIYAKKFNTSLGLVTCMDNGEWGGELILVGDDEEYHFDSSSYSFEYVFEYGGKVYAISSLAHLFGRKCSLHEIRKSSENYLLVTIFESNDTYFSGYYIDENYLYFYSNEHYNGLCRFNLDDNQLEIIHTHLCSSINVNSLIKG